MIRPSLKSAPSVPYHRRKSHTLYIEKVIYVKWAGIELIPKVNPKGEMSNSHKNIITTQQSSNLVIWTNSQSNNIYYDLSLFFLWGFLIEDIKTIVGNLEKIPLIRYRSLAKRIAHIPNHRGGINTNSRSC